MAVTNVVINGTLDELTTAFMSHVKEVTELPDGVHTCLGAFSPTITPKGLEGNFIIFHLRPHAFWDQVPFVNNLSSLLHYVHSNDPGVKTEPYIIFSFLECVRRHLGKETVYWKVLDKRAGSFEVYV